MHFVWLRSPDNIFGALYVSEVSLPTNELVLENKISDFLEIDPDTMVVRQFNVSQAHVTLLEEPLKGDTDLRSQPLVEETSAHQTGVQVSDVENQLVVNIDQEKQKLMEFSFRKLRLFCVCASIAGYSAYVNGGGKEGLVDYLLSLSG